MLRSLRSRGLCTRASLWPTDKTKRWTLFDLCAELPNYGVGSKVYSKSLTWLGSDPEKNFFAITRCNLRRKDVWALMCKDGRLSSTPRPLPLRDADRRDWMLLSCAADPGQRSLPRWDGSSFRVTYPPKQAS